MNIEAILEARDQARKDGRTQDYKLFSRIAGDYQLGEKSKKPKTGPGAVIEIVRDLIGGNNKTVETLKERNNSGEWDDKIIELNTQTELLEQYVPALLTVDQLGEILAAHTFVNKGEFRKYLDLNHAHSFAPGDAARTFDANKQG